MWERCGRRALGIAAATVLVGVPATGCGKRAAEAGDGKPDAPAAYTSVEKIPETLAPDGTTIRVGSPRAKIVVHVYEDMRCPVCEQFETQGGGEALREMVLSGEVRAEYTLASFLDDRVGGQGSKKAVNALRAALEAGKFVEYHEALFAHQPDEDVDGFTDRFLLETAAQVPDLRDEEFDAAVENMKYGAFVTASQKAFQKSGVSGTPTMKVNGRTVPDHLSRGIFDKEALPLVVGATVRS